MQNNRKARRERWWQFAERAPNLYKAIANLDRVLVIAQVSRTVMPALVPTRASVLAQAGEYSPRTSTASLAFHVQLNPFTHGRGKTSATLKADLRTTRLLTVFETLPQPTHTDRLTSAGETLDNVRASVMKRRESGPNRPLQRRSQRSQSRGRHRPSPRDPRRDRRSGPRSLRPRRGARAADPRVRGQDRVRAAPVLAGDRPRPRLPRDPAGHPLHDQPAGPRRRPGQAPGAQPLPLRPGSQARPAQQEEVPVQGHGPDRRRPPPGRRHPVLAARRAVLEPEATRAEPVAPGQAVVQCHLPAIEMDGSPTRLPHPPDTRGPPRHPRAPRAATTATACR